MPDINNLDEFEVFVPPVPDIDRAISFVDSLFQSPVAQKYVFNFSSFNWVRPFSLIFLSNQIRSFILSRLASGSKAFARNYSHATYAAHMGFFQHFGLNFGNKPGQASGSATYLPITFMNISDISSAAAANLEIPQVLIEKDAKRLAALLVRASSGNTFDAIAYAFREIIRNVYEHSQSKYVGYVAQFWPRRSEVEIVILDGGVGLKDTLSKNPCLEIHSDRDALNLALLPGVSGAMFPGKKRDFDDPWENSGYGLYMTSRLCRDKGSFLLCSGESGMLLKKEAKKYVSIKYPGTIVRMVISTNRLENLAVMLKQFALEGKEVSQKYQRVGYMSASKASKMVSSDFKEVKSPPEEL